MANHEREFEYTPRDFVRVKDLLYRHAGIVLNDSKDSLVYSRLVRRCEPYKSVASRTIWMISIQIVQSGKTSSMRLPRI